MKQLLITTVILIGNFSFAIAQESEPELITEFFRNYETKGADEAFDIIFSTNKWILDSKGQVENIKAQLKSTINLLGKYHGFEKIGVASVGKDLRLNTYLIKYERQPIRFSILVYRPDEIWQLQNFSFDDNIDEELIEALKAYRLKENLPKF